MAATTVAGPNLGKGLKTPVQVARFWDGGAVSTPLLFETGLVSAGYDQRVHLYDITYTPAQKGDAGALPSANGDGKLLDGVAQGAGPVLRRRRLRVHADAVERPRVRRLPRRLSCIAWATSPERVKAEVAGAGRRFSGRRP